MQYETNGLPTFHGLLLAEGRSTKGTTSALAVALKANPSRGDPGLIYISPDLVKDIKDCNYGFGGEKSYGNCHRGISPFSVPHTSLKLQQERRVYQDRLALASNVTITDIARGEASPVMVPQDYGELLRLLSNYIRLVTAVLALMIRVRTRYTGWPVGVPVGSVGVPVGVSHARKTRRERGGLLLAISLSNIHWVVA
jgi:hypothetical protein